MKKSLLDPSEALYPLPVVLVSARDPKTGRPNAITIAWCGVLCSEPPTIGISIRPHRFSHRIIKESGSFVVNIPTASLAEKVDACGVISGSRTDKLSAVGLTAGDASRINAPLIVECPVNIECTLKDIVPLGTHDLFIGLVVAVNVDEDLLDAKGKIDFSKAHPYVYNQGEYWSLGKRIGRYGFSQALI